MRNLYRLVLASSLFLSNACSDVVSPADRALDGPWSTGRTLSGVVMVLTLTWSRDRVTGTGSVNAVPSPAHCGTAVIEQLTTVTLAASRRSSTEIRGTIAIGGGSQLTYQGSLIGANHIDGVLIAADGSQCAMTLFQGLVP